MVASRYLLCILSGGRHVADCTPDEEIDAALERAKAFESVPRSLSSEKTARRCIGLSRGLSS
jgi:hypothetical protein